MFKKHKLRKKSTIINETNINEKEIKDNKLEFKKKNLYDLSKWR